MKERFLETSGRTFVTADTHFGQADACASFERPFRNSTAMQKEIISRFNAVLGPEDLLLHLGDFVGNQGSTKEKARLDSGLAALKVAATKRKVDEEASSSSAKKGKGSAAKTSEISAAMAAFKGRS